jgi:hypothetical protein
MVAKKQVLTIGKIPRPILGYGRSPFWTGNRSPFWANRDIITGYYKKKLNKERF